MAANMLRILRSRVFQIETRLLQALGCQNQHDQMPPPGFALAGAPPPTHTSQPPAPQDAKSLLDSIFDGIAWLAVPKRRRSVEKRMKRRMGTNKIDKYSTPKKNIVACLECGHWHERHTICGSCYDKVKKETEVMRETMDEDDRRYNAPKTEVVYLYEDDVEEREQHAGRYVVEMPKKRPSWWNRNLLTRANRL